MGRKPKLQGPPHFGTTRTSAKKRAGNPHLLEQVVNQANRQAVLGPRKKSCSELASLSSSDQCMQDLPCSSCVEDWQYRAALALPSLGVPSDDLWALADLPPLPLEELWEPGSLTSELSSVTASEISSEVGRAR